MTLEALLDAAQLSAGEACLIAAGENAAATAAALDAAVLDSPPLVVVSGDAGAPAGHAEAWACGRDDWLVLADPPTGHGVLAPVATVARAPMPGSWRGGRRPPTAMPATSARAALVDTRGQELDRMRAVVLQERAWVAAEAERLRDSQSWRLGHRLVRTARMLTFRRDRGTDALARLIERANAPLDP